ncbi:MAG: two-component sensor histidine kinase [Kordia sp.]|nr:MAG: two-component sensor histidine kinase [Kordia sp.]
MEEFFTEENKIIPIVLSAIFLLLFMAVTLVLFFHFARKKIVEKELEKSAIKLDGQKKILQATIETQERERKRIAQDLHDAISAKLNVVSLHVNMLMDGSLTTTEQQDALGSVLDVTTTVLESSRQIAHDLLPPILDNFGLVEALKELLAEFGATKKVVAQHNINYLTSLTKVEELHLFRIVQELLNNSIRHGKATIIRLELHDADRVMQLVYKDNGKGFLVKQALKESGLGLKNIKSRIAILNGELHIKSNLNEGATFTININHNSYE